MNTDTKQNINANIILAMILIFILMHLLATVHIFATICFEDRNLILL